MKKWSIIVFLAVVALIAMFAWQKRESAGETPSPSLQIRIDQPGDKLPGDPKDASYVIEGDLIVLDSGRAATPAAPGSAVMIETEYFGNEAKGDLSSDGIADTAFLLTQSGGGTGTFFYAVAAIKEHNGYRGTNAIFLGDRIAPQSTEIRDGVLIVNYMDRSPDEPFIETPSRGVSKYMRFRDGRLVEVK